MGYLGSKGRHYMIPGSKDAGCRLSLNPNTTKLKLADMCKNCSYKSVPGTDMGLSNSAVAAETAGSFRAS